MSTIATSTQRDSSTNRVRILDAALACVARTGTKKLTVDDIATEASVSRATIYRTFDGGRDEILAQAVATEVARFFSTVATQMGRAANLSELICSMVTVSATYLSNHETLRYLRANEPETVFTHLTFGQFDGTLAHATAFAQPFFVQWLEPDEAGRAAELVVRLIVSHLIDPDPTFDLEDPAQVTRFVDTYVVSALLAPKDQRTERRSKKGRST